MQGRIVNSVLILIDKNCEELLHFATFKGEGKMTGIKKILNLIKDKLCVPIKVGTD